MTDHNDEKRDRDAKWAARTQLGLLRARLLKLGLYWLAADRVKRGPMANTTSTRRPAGSAPGG